MTLQTRPLRIGTRASDLALWQANAVRDALIADAGLEPEAIEIVARKTAGDQVQDRPLRDLGGKGLFTRDIQEALIDDSVDLAVHSAKDMETRLPEGLAIAGYLPRADPREAFVSARYPDPADLPESATIGTASLRRQALVRRMRPDLRIVLLRGNVPTRLQKAESGDCDGTFLAVAGLLRLGLVNRATAILDTAQFPPACGQAAVAIECRSDDLWARECVARINHPKTEQAIVCERAFLAALGGSCRSPIAGHARHRDGRLEFHGLVIAPNGVRYYEDSRSGSPADAASIGNDAGVALKARAPAAFLVEIGVT